MCKVTHWPLTTIETMANINAGPRADPIIDDVITERAPQKRWHQHIGEAMTFDVRPMSKMRLSQTLLSVIRSACGQLLQHKMHNTESQTDKRREINSPIQPCAQTIKHSMPALKQTGQSYSPGGYSVQLHPTRHNIVDFDTRVFLLRLTINCKKTSSSSTFSLGSVFSNHVAVYRDYR